MRAVSGSKKRIGVLCNHIGGATRPHENEVVKALFDVARERNFDLVFLPGRFFRQTAIKSIREHFLFNALAASCVDGFIIHSSLLHRYLYDLDFTAFLQNLGDIPVLSLGVRFGDLPTVMIDNKQAMRELVFHLTDHHGAKRIAFVRGPVIHPEAEDRFEGYRIALADRGLAYEPDLVFPGEFNRLSGAEAVKSFSKLPGFPFDAIVAANDETALGVMEALKDYGLRCPEDVLLGGFDDVEASRLSLPPLLTVRQDICCMARKAGNLLCDTLEGKSPLHDWLLPATLLPRASCGCSVNLTAINDTGDHMVKRMQASIQGVSRYQRSFFEENCARLAAAPNEAMLTQILMATELREIDPGIWLEPIQLLCNLRLSPNGTLDGAGNGERLLSLSRLAAVFAINARRREEYRQDDFSHVLAEISQALTGVTSLAQLGEIITAQLGRLDIDLCLIALTKKSTEGRGSLHPAIVCSQSGCLEFPKDNQLSISRGLSGYGEPQVQIVESLTLRDEYFGIVVFGMAKPLGNITSILKMHLSGAIKSIYNHVENEQKRSAMTALNRQYEKQLYRLSGLRKIDLAITAEQTSDELLDTLLEQTTSQLAVDAAAILLPIDDGSALEFGAVRGFRTEALKFTKLKLGEGYAGEAALGQGPIIVSDLCKSPKDFARSPLLKQEGFAAYCAAPLIARGVLKGVLELFNRSPLHPDNEWREFLEALSSQVAIALDNRSLIHGLRKANEDLLLAYDETIEGWSRALDLRDRETKGHSIRVAVKTVELGRQLKMNEADLAQIYRGALLHDIGKVGIPDSILFKPGKLNEEETAIMHCHPRYAYDLLYPIKYLRPVIDIPYCHHEKWDGSGYPRGLAGEAIPLAARIFAVIDVWDALTSERPYRQAWSITDAKAYIRSQAGKHFDPEVVKQFL